MITVILKGLLGNILFQYAVGRHLAAKHGTGLRLDLVNYMWRRDIFAQRMARQIGAFNLKAGLYRPVHRGIVKMLRRSFGLRRPGGRVGVYQEERNGYHPDVLQLEDGVRLDGFFQTEEYFKDIEPVIRRDLTFKPRVLGARAAGYEERIRGSQSVGLHIRRGDYLMSPMHNVCTPTYYSRAVAYVREHVDNPRFFIFSDDIVWCRRNLDIADSTCVDTRSPRCDPTVDLRLMSLCRHNIIANSTFSWWAAWLNDNPAKIVVAPNKWFNEEAKNARALEDTIPDGWVRVDF